VKLSEIRSTLREIRVSPVKTLGQNFLHDQNVARWIVDQAEIDSADYVVEIGPGLGALTEFVLAKGARVLAIEKDARLADFLRTRFTTERFELLHADALDFDPRTLFAQPRVKLLGNLPYNVASQLLLSFLAYPTPFSLVILMFQKEMAERIAAGPGTKNYGALSVQIQFRYHVRHLKKVPASVFFPEPEVDSAVVLLKPRAEVELPFCDADLIGELVRHGFSQRRKQLGKLLRDYVDDWPKAAEVLRLERQVRAEELSLEKWIALTNYIRPIPSDDQNNQVAEQFPVVDEADAVLRAASRREVHANNLRHRAVHLLIFNALGEVFLQKRSRGKDRHPLLWDSSAAGHVNAGEDYDFAAKRELEEELGVAIDLEKVAKLPASAQSGQEFIWIYQGRFDGPFRLNLAEIEYGAFIPIGVVTDWLRARPNDFAPAFAECWKAFLEKQQTS
jgi:16S rRNA (adenine1518-N6/adenine1519-N6)-dimethyltransferase